MIRAFLLATAFSLSWADSVLAAPSLDLTPIVKDVRVDGASRRLVFFRSAHTGLGRLSLVEYAAPWPVHGGRESAIMSIPGKDACASISSLETPDPVDWEDEATVVDWVKRMVPAEASGFHIEEIVRDPVRLNEHSTIEVIMCYSLFGRPLQISAFVCRRKGERQNEVFLFQLASTPVHFKEVHQTFRASLYSIVGF
jgi:hypothetical protein